MKTFLKSVGVLCFCFCVAVSGAYAQGRGEPTDDGTPSGRAPATNDGTPAGEESRGLTNPLQVDSIQELLVILLNIVILIATPIVVLFIILAGFKYVTAQGDVGKVKEATQALTNAIIGGILIIGAIAITRIIENLVSAFL